jgi:NADPH2:quinone reductase
MTIPNIMNVMEIQGEAGHFGLAAAQRPVPRPEAGAVLIAVRAAGINGHDVHQIHRGSHPINPGETDLPGLEVAGTVVAVGAEVDQWRVGDDVCALLRGGGYAEYAVAPQGNCLPKPANLDWTEAAALPETYFTVWSNVFVDCALADGESFLMNGGTSGIGVAAIQIASVLGHSVYATARGAEKVAICENIGASRGIDYQTENFAEVIQDITAGRGVDVILDVVAGEYLPLDMEAAALGGRIVFIGGARGFESKINIRQLMHKRLRVQGSLLRPRSNVFKTMVRDQLRERVWPHVLSGRIKPMLHRAYAFNDAMSAIHCLENREQVGKVVLAVAEAD